MGDHSRLWLGNTISRIAGLLATKSCFIADFDSDALTPLVILATRQNIC
jgi:hypothetical protein